MESGELGHSPSCHGVKKDRIVESVMSNAEREGKDRRVASKIRHERIRGVLRYLNCLCCRAGCNEARG